MVISQMNQYGKISVCGSISSYNDKSLPKGKTYFTFNVIDQKGKVTYIAFMKNSLPPFYWQYKITHTTVLDKML